MHPKDKPFRWRVRLLLLALVMLSACEFDKGLAPLDTRISGKVVYLPLGLPPASINEVRVAALLKFPPSGLGDVFFSDPIDFVRNNTSGIPDTADFEILLPAANYPALVVLWKPRNEGWSFNSLLGIYGITLSELELRSINLTPEQPIQDDVEIQAIWLFANTDATVNGTITYEGTLPSDTEALLLTGFKQIPNDFDDLVSAIFQGGINLGGLPLPVSGARRTTGYQIRLANGQYDFFCLFWKGVNTPFENMKVIGYYRNPATPGQPGQLDLPLNGAAFDININADFNTLPDGIRP